MRRGTTPTHTFKSPVDLTDAVELFMTYRQGGKTIIEKSLDDIEVEPEQLVIHLSQTDTLAFSTIGDVEIQCRARYASGDAIASNIITIKACKILKEGVI